MNIIDFIRVVDKYFNGLLCLIIGFFKRKHDKPSKIKKTAFIKLWALGDSVTTLPLIKEIKKKTNSKITIICMKRNIEVYKRLKFVDKIIIFDLKNLLRIVFLRKKFDVAFDLEPYLNFSALLTNFVSRYAIGFSNQHRSSLYDYKQTFSRKKHVVDIYLGLGKLFGVGKITTLVKLVCSENDKSKTKKFLEKNKVTNSDLLIGICPGAAESVKERMWSEKKFASLADKLIKNYSAKIVFIGSIGEKELINSIRKLMKYKSINSAGKLNLRQVFYLIEKCKIFISNDTGPMHIAAAQGCKVIGLFGPNTPVRWAPFGIRNISVYHKLRCSPCIINEEGIMPKCINKEFQKCMKLISIEEVEKAVVKLLR